MAAVAVMKPKAADLHDQKMEVDIEESEEDLYTKLKTLQRQLEFIEIQVCTGDRPLPQGRGCCGAGETSLLGLRLPPLISPPAPVPQEEYIKEEQKNLKRELLRAQEEVKRIQSVPLVIGQFLEMIDANTGIVGSTTGSNYHVRILSTLNRELLKPSASVALHRHSNALVDVLPPEADSSISLLADNERPDVTYQVCAGQLTPRCRRCFLPASSDPAPPPCAPAGLLTACRRACCRAAGLTPPAQDIGGYDIQKQEIREAVELPLVQADLYRQIGIDPPRGVLLYGPPGTGKTMLAKAVAHHTTAAFIRVVGSEFVQKYLGEVGGLRAACLGPPAAWAADAGAAWARHVTAAGARPGPSLPRPASLATAADWALRPRTARTPGCCRGLRPPPGPSTRTTHRAPPAPARPPQGPRMVRDVFRLAKENAPAITFIDEVGA
jgi:hypothetical protein